MIDIHTHTPNGKMAIVSLFHHQTIPDLKHFSVGIHPWHTDNLHERDIDILRVKAKHLRCLAIGECGFDKLKGGQIATQKQVFEKQIEMSEELNKPMIIHCVKAFNELIDMKKKHKPNQAWIVHGFFAKPNILKTLLDNDFYISFGSTLLNNLDKLKSYLDIVPDNRMFVETDESNLAISDFYCAIQELKSVDLLHLQRQIESNFKNCFHIDSNELA